MTSSRIPKPLQAILLILCGLGLLAVHGWREADWLKLWVGAAEGRQARATIIDTHTTSSGLGGRRGLVLDFRYDVNGQTYRDDTSILDIAASSPGVQPGEPIPIIYHADDPGRAIYAGRLRLRLTDVMLGLIALAFMAFGVIIFRR